MPLYKYYKHEVDVRRAERLHRRMRLAAVVISCLLLIGTLTLLMGQALLRMRWTVSVPALGTRGGTAAVLDAGAQ